MRLKLPVALLFTLSLLLHLSVQVNNNVEDAIITKLNDPNKMSTWKARRNFPESKLQELRSLINNRVKLYNSDKPIMVLYHKPEDEQTRRPRQFDARKRWPKCKKIIETIGNQGSCIASWAATPASVISDRLCIESDGVNQFQVSVEHIMSCCTLCKESRNGCYGGMPGAVWTYWISDGLVSGGIINSSEGCKPLSSRIFSDAITPSCKAKCSNPSYKVSYEDDKKYGGIAYKTVVSEEQIEIEIMKYGPVTANMRLFSEFLYYGSGVYVHHTGVLIGSHMVRILGWGAEGREKYWLCACNWGTEWGEYGGFFKIRKGSNHCGIEGEVRAGRTSSELSASEIAEDSNGHTNVKPSLVTILSMFYIFVNLKVLLCS